MQRGQLGEAAVITINKKEANINSKIIKNDIIEIKESTVGEPASLKIVQLPEYKSQVVFNVNDVAITCPKFASANGELVTASYEIKDNDKIEILEYYSVSQIMKFMDIDTNNKEVYVNGHKSLLDEPVYSGFVLNIVEKSETVESEEITGEAKSTEDSQPENTESTDVGEAREEALNVSVVVNNTPVVLSGKSSYIFVDILDFYPFDTSVAKGTNLVMRINGIDSSFTDKVADNDIIDLYWEN